jgi:hypothetical protein
VPWRMSPEGGPDAACHSLPVHASAWCGAGCCARWGCLTWHCLLRPWSRCSISASTADCQHPRGRRAQPGPALGAGALPAADRAGRTAPRWRPRSRRRQAALAPAQGSHVDRAAGQRRGRDPGWPVRSQRPCPGGEALLVLDGRVIEQPAGHTIDGRRCVRSAQVRLLRG